MPGAMRCRYRIDAYAADGVARRARHLVTRIMMVRGAGLEFRRRHDLQSFTQ
jgi:hypothetical protein